MLLSPDWRPPDDALTSWMQGTSHRTPSQVWTNSYYAARRWQAFYDACRNCDPQLAIWPEFDQNLRRLRLTKWYQKCTISTEVAGLLILEDNRSFSPWMARAGWLGVARIRWSDVGITGSCATSTRISFRKPAAWPSVASSKPLLSARFLWRRLNRKLIQLSVFLFAKIKKASMLKSTRYERPAACSRAAATASSSL